jgi:FdhD protein
MIKDKIEIKRYHYDKYEKKIDTSVVEFKLKIFVNNRPVLERLCLKENLEDMVVGFLVTEGYISTMEDVEKIDFKIEREKEGLCYCIIDKNPNKLTKKSKNCSTTGKDVIEAMERFTKMSSLFSETGGVHSSAVLINREIVYFADDIGRQNALDKAVGYVIRNENKLKEVLILFSGRITTEVIGKLIPKSIEGIVSKAAVTKNAVETASEIDMLVIGFARGERFNLYTGGERLKDY